MSLVVVVGDVTTTTTLALASVWPGADRTADDVLVLEADPRGGSMAAWLDIPSTPSLSTVVTRAADGGWPAVRSLAHPTTSGLHVLIAPVRSLEASRAIAEADRWLFGLLAGLAHPVVLADVGPVASSASSAGAVHPLLRHADVAVVVHRQARQSARAAAVRIERLAEAVEMVTAVGCPVVLAVVGDAPFDPAEIVRFVAGSVGPDGSLPPLVALADDPLAAAVLAGRSGVSARRLARLPLMRSAAELADTSSVVLGAARSDPTATTVRRAR